MSRKPLPVGTWGTITFNKMANGRVRAKARYRDLDGVTRPVTKFGKSKSEAQRELLTALQARAGYAGGAITRDSTINEVAELWLQEISESDRAASTKDNWARVVRNRINPGIGNLSLAEATIPVLDMTLSTIRQNTGLAAAQTAKTVLSGIFGHAVRLGALSANPVGQTLRLSSSKAERVKPRALTAGEVSQLIRALDDDPAAVSSGLRDLVRFMLGTGVRIGEALALTHDDVDFSTGTAEISSTLTDAKGRGTFIQPHPKTAAGHRVIALPLDVVNLLRERTELIWPDNSQHLFFPNDLGHVWQRGKVSRQLRGVLDTAGFQWVTSHTFRKTVATRLDECGLTARQIAVHLGHEKPSMTTDVYMGRDVASAHASEFLAWG